MKIESARPLIAGCAERMNALSGDCVFDEWAVVALTRDGAKLVAYQGPRVERFRSRFNADIQPLREELEGRRLQVGEFAFVQDAAGTAYDACVRIGAQVYLWWNNTDATMADIRARGSWLPAQTEFAKLCDQFRRDPVVVE
jgi:hypothetical protein